MILGQNRVFHEGNNPILFNSFQNEVNGIRHRIIASFTGQPKSNK